MRQYFDELISWASSQLQGDEVLTASLSAEGSDFVRFNRGEVRQAGSVQQCRLSIDLIEGAVHAEAAVQLAQDLTLDQARLSTLIGQLREQRALAPPDPYLTYATDAEAGSTELIHDGTVPEPGWAIDRIQSAAAGNDLVGIYAAGSIYNGFANSLGQRNWFECSTFNFDWSFYLQADKAVKNLYAGRHWDEAALESKLSSSADQLSALARPPVTLDPGRYRTYLAPAAMVSLVDMICWGGFSLESHRTKQTPLLRMATEGATLNPSVRIIEDTAKGVAPNFQQNGFARPDEVVLIDSGTYNDWLVSPRSGIEYDVPNNGAAPWEQPEAFAMGGGSLPGDEILGVLDTGLYVGNLWYLNFSDRAACRTTGMTRFATFWVENGEIVAPANVMRFDDTAYHMLGSNLVGLTEDVEIILDPSTYVSRSTSSFRLPGAVVDEMAFTL
ncbi:MAG: TldE/PmbA family protein [Actinomycetia bacterium]|nr:TldE/PmbA family protein [Actinomycetes bacterium]